MLKLRKKIKVFIKKFLSQEHEPIKETWINAPSRQSSVKDFLSWFDATESEDGTKAKAKIDWVYRFQSTKPFLNLKNKRIAVEIGFGGGRLIAEAAREFDFVFGIDIHKEFQRTSQFIKAQDVENFSLLTQEDCEKVEDSSVDFVYSFIVFQHFDSIEEILFYLDFIQRKLSATGVAHIYYAKQNKPGYTFTPPDEFLERDCSLFINSEYMNSLLRERNFRILEEVTVCYKDPIDRKELSEQASITFSKH